MSTYLSKMGTGLLKVNFQNSAFPRPQLIQSASFLLVGCFVISWYISYYDCQALSEMSTHVFKMVNYTVKVVLNRRSKTFRIVSLFDQIATQLPILAVERISVLRHELPDFFRLHNFFLCRCLPESN